MAKNFPLKSGYETSIFQFVFSAYQKIPFNLLVDRPRTCGKQTLQKLSEKRLENFPATFLEESRSHFTSWKILIRSGVKNNTRKFHKAVFRTQHFPIFSQSLFEVDQIFQLSIFSLKSCWRYFQTFLTIWRLFFIFVPFMRFLANFGRIFMFPGSWKSRRNGN